MIEIIKGGKTFYWKGKYHENMIGRDTLSTELNVLENLTFIINSEFSSSEIICIHELSSICTKYSYKSMFKS